MAKAKFKIGDIYAPELMSLNSLEKRDVMESVAYKVSDEGYSKILTESDLIEKKDELSEVVMEISEIEERKKITMNDFKKQLEVPLETKKELLQAIRSKTEFRQGIVFYVDDQDANKMYIFDEFGECIDVRQLRKDERQVKIKMLKTGTDE
jgi:hypothetical protein